MIYCPSIPSWQRKEVESPTAAQPILGSLLLMSRRAFRTVKLCVSEAAEAMALPESRQENSTSRGRSRSPFFKRSETFSSLRPVPCLLEREKLEEQKKPDKPALKDTVGFQRKVCYA